MVKAGMMIPASWLITVMFMSAISHCIKGDGSIVQPGRQRLLRREEK